MTFVLRCVAFALAAAFPAVAETLVAASGEDGIALRVACPQAPHRAVLSGYPIPLPAPPRARLFRYRLDGAAPAIGILKAAGDGVVLRFPSGDWLNADRVETLLPAAWQRLAFAPSPAAAAACGAAVPKPEKRARIAAIQAGLAAHGRALDTPPLTPCYRADIDTHCSFPDAEMERLEPRRAVEAESDVQMLRDIFDNDGGPGAAALPTGNGPGYTGGGGYRSDLERVRLAGSVPFMGVVYGRQLFGRNDVCEAGAMSRLKLVIDRRTGDMPRSSCRQRSVAGRLDVSGRIARVRIRA